MLRRLLTPALVAGALFGAPAVADAAIREVPQDYPTIQLAVDAANAGDTIAISKKRNFEHVTVPTANLLIKGVKPGVVVDGYVNGVGNSEQFLINAGRVRLANLVLRNGYGVYCNVVDRCAANKLRFSGIDSNCFYSATGVGTRLTNSVLRNCDSTGALVVGDDALIRNNVIKRTDTGCISVSGSGAVVRGNRIVGCEDEDAIHITGDRGLAQDNLARGIDGNMVEITGENARIIGNRGSSATAECFFVTGLLAKIRGNRASSCAGGIDATGDNPQITGNRFATLTGYGITADCDNSCGDMEISDNLINGTTNDSYGMFIEVPLDTGSALIARNTIRDASESGIYFSTWNARMVRNVVNGAGLEGEAGIRIGGSGNTAIGNRVLNANTDGFELGGSGPNLFEDNVARGNGGDGFQITPPATDIELNGNVAIGNGADGFENDAADTVLRRNQASGNHRDCANDGTIALKKKNKCADGSNFNQPGTASPRHRAR